MTQNLYAMLGVSEKAPIPEIREAYKRKLGALVHRKHSAERSKSAMAELYREEHALREAMSILTDPARRSMYNSFRAASDKSLPSTPQELWAQVEGAVVDKNTMAALRLLASLTTLPLQELPLLKIPTPTKPEEEKTEPIGLRPSSLKNRSQRADVRETIKQVTTKTPSFMDDVPLPKQKDDSIGHDATELIQGNTKKVAQTPLDTLKERVQRSSKSPTPSTVTQSKGKSTTAKPSAKPQKTPKPKPKLTMAELVREHGYTGRLFRAIRENQSISMSELSQRTNVPVNYIQAIENEDFSIFSSPVFIRGVVKNISRSLGIQDRMIISGFLDRVGF